MYNERENDHFANDHKSVRHNLSSFQLFSRKMRLVVVKEEEVPKKEKETGTACHTHAYVHARTHTHTHTHKNSTGSGSLRNHTVFSKTNKGYHDLRTSLPKILIIL